MNRFGACLVATLLTSCQTADDPGVASVAAQPSCSSSPSARDEVADTVRAFFEALARDDTEVGRLTTPDFHAFDVGRRFTGPELSRLIADAHRSGRILQWNIGPVDTQVDCNSAFAFWENVGASGRHRGWNPGPGWSRPTSFGGTAGGPSDFSTPRPRIQDTDHIYIKG